MKKKEETTKIMPIIEIRLNDMFGIESKKIKEEVEKIDETINKTILQKFFNHEESDERKLKLAELDKAKELAKSSEQALVFSTKSDLNSFQKSVEAMTSDLIKEVINVYSLILDESIEDTQKITTELYKK